MDNESEIRSADEDRIHEDLLNRAIAPFMTENGVNVPADHGLLILADDKAGDISVPFMICEMMVGMTARCDWRGPKVLNGRSTTTGNSNDR